MDNFFRLFGEGARAENTQNNIFATGHYSPYRVNPNTPLTNNMTSYGKISERERRPGHKIAPSR